VKNTSLVENFLEVLASEKGLARNTIQSYKSDLDQFINFIEKKECDIKRLSVDNINEFV
jgi:site-specific recombinase XerD